MPSRSTLPPNTWAKASVAIVEASISRSAATSAEYATTRGAATGVGETREYSAPCTCRVRFAVSASPGSSCTKRLSKWSASIELTPYRSHTVGGECVEHAFVLAYCRRAIEKHRRVVATQRSKERGDIVS